MFALVLALACIGPKDSSALDDTATTVPEVDPDGDGVLPPDDCDDTRADVHPGAEDANGDGVDADCDGTDGTAFVGCSPIDVPDVYPTIEDAIDAGDAGICLGEGTFTPGPLPEGAYGVSSFRGQGRDKTVLVDAAGYYPVSVLEGLTATGQVTRSGSVYFTSVNLEDALIVDFDNFSCEKCALIRSTVEMYVKETIRGIVLTDSWITEGDPGVHLEMDACTGTCADYCDVRLNNVTFTANTVAFAMDLRGAHNIFFDLENSIFADQTEALLTIDRGSGSGSSPDLYPSGNGNLQWNNGPDPFPDGEEFSANEKDPELDMAFRPPRPGPDSPAVDSAGDEATSTDYWGHPRKVPDKGAVER